MPDYIAIHEAVEAARQNRGISVARELDGAKSIIETIGLLLSLLAPFNDKNDD